MKKKGRRGRLETRRRRRRERLNEGEEEEKREQWKREKISDVSKKKKKKRTCFLPLSLLSRTVCCCTSARSFTRAHSVPLSQHSKGIHLSLPRLPLFTDIFSSSSQVLVEPNVMSMHISAYSAILYLLEGDIASVKRRAGEEKKSQREAKEKKRKKKMQPKILICFSGSGSSVVSNRSNDSGASAALRGCVSALSSAASPHARNSMGQRHRDRHRHRHR